jgi:hypothetical protein
MLILSLGHGLDLAGLEDLQGLLILGTLVKYMCPKLKAIN